MVPHTLEAPLSSRINSMSIYGKERCALYTCAEFSQCKIVCGLIADHTDLSPAGMAAPCQMRRQPVGCSARETMIPSQGTNARERRVLPADRSLERWTAPSEVQEKHTGKARCALFTCVECSQRRIACRLIADHTDLSPAGMAAPSQVQRQPAGCSAGEAMVLSPNAQSLSEGRTDSSATITEGEREDNAEDIDACPQITDDPAARRQRIMEWEERGRFPSKEQWQQSFRNEGQFVTHSTKNTTQGVVKLLCCVYGKKVG